MPRLSLRRTCLCLVAVATVALVSLNMFFRDQWLVSRYSQHNGGSGSGPLAGRETRDGHMSLYLVSETSSSTRDKETVHRQDNEVSNKNWPSPPRPWFMKDGWVRPEPAPYDRTAGRRVAQLWPHESDEDRIVNQLMHVPPNLAEITQNGTKLKKILLYNGISNWLPLKQGRDVFLKDKCPVDTCTITANREEFLTSDAVLFRDHFSPPRHRRPLNQAWILYLLECPMHTQSFNLRKLFNWTATYRHDSDLVAPYEKFVPYDSNSRLRPTTRNYAANKTKKVAWFVSNCGARNRRLEYARQLSWHIEVDIYGACGTKTCPRSRHKKCFEMLERDYKFYLSFENSNCKDYITEKFFVNGLGQDVVPIVMGARKEDYLRAAPPHSFISVEDFASPKELADYLNVLDKNDTMYNKYFEWKGTGEFINTYFWCRMCAVLHDKAPRTVYDDLDAWWRGVDSWWHGPGACAYGLWRDEAERLKKMVRPAENTS